MKAVIMAGGFGTRLRPLTEGVPKPCVSVGGIPCIVRMVRKLASFGIREFHVSLCYLPQQIRAVLEVPEFRPLSIVFHEETVPLGTAGSVRNCLPDCDDDFIIASGDGVFDFDLTLAYDFHRRHGGPLTVLSAKAEDPGEYGVILSDSEGKIRQFYEKPDWSHAYSDDVNTGIYLCSPSFLSHIPEGVCDFSKDVFPSMLSSGVPLYQYSIHGYWCDIGTVSSYLECNRYLLSNGEDRIPSSVDAESVIEPPCYIGENVHLERCHIGPYTVIEDGCHLRQTRLEGSVLQSGVRCEAGSRIRNAVICKNASVGQDVRIGDECVIGADCEVGAGATVPAGVKIFPSNRIPAKTFLVGNVHHKLRPLFPEDGRILFPFGEDFGGASIYEIGRALSELYGGDLVVGRAEPRDASAVMTFCGGALACGKNVYDTGVNDLSQFRFTVRNYAFRGGAFFQRNYSNLVLRLFDGNGMPLPNSAAKSLMRNLAQESFCGENDGLYRIFRGGAKAYRTYLRSFGLPSKLFLRVAASPVLSPLLPHLPESDARERMQIGPEWVRIERSNGDPYDEDLIRLCACIGLGRKQSPVRFPDLFPQVTESVAESFRFRALRCSDDGIDGRKTYPLTDPNVQALLILNLLESEKCSFGQFVARLPVFSVKRREVSLNIPRGTVMRRLVSSGGELSSGIRFSDARGIVRIFPLQNSNAFRICSESRDAESAEELCNFYSMKLKGLKPD